MKNNTSQFALKISESRAATTLHVLVHVALTPPHPPPPPALASQSAMLYCS